MKTNSSPRPESGQALNQEQLQQEHIDLLNHYDRDETKSKGSYSVEFDGNFLKLAGLLTTDIEPILKMDAETSGGFKATIAAIAHSGSRAPVTLRSHIANISRAIKDKAILNFSPENYAQLIQDKDSSVANSFKSVMNIWYRLGIPGISSETIDLVNMLKRPASRGRNRVTSGDPTEGWYTSQEYDDLISLYWDDLESGKSTLRDSTTLLLNAQFGRRGIQLANLKVCDFKSEGQTDGISGKRIVFPGAKDKSAEEWFRGSKSETHPVGDDLWDLCTQQIKSTIAHHEVFFGRKLDVEEIDQLPFLQKHTRTLGHLKHFDFLAVESDSQATAIFHLSPASVSAILGRSHGTKILSQRTGEPVREFAYRMRYTRARQLARMGVPRNTLQYWLGHEKDGALEHYYDDPAEDARQLDIEMQTILAPLAQAFLGSLRDRESDAIRGDDPSSRIELDGRNNLGTCGEHGFCSASVPIPCYRCSKFQPWVDAPHEEVLIRLIERQEEENNIHLPSKSRRMLIPLQLEKDIAAVKLVITLCNARKREIFDNQQS
jgi:integrase